MATASKLESWLESNSGWGRLLVTVCFLVGQAFWITKDLQDKAETSTKEASEFRVQMSILQASISSLSTEINHLAVNNEAMKQISTNNTERIRRLEQIEDGRNGNRHPT